jgi:hypothetical protein
MKSPIAADFSAPYVALGGVLCFMSGNIYKHSWKMYYMYEEIMGTDVKFCGDKAVVVDITGNWHPRIFTYSCLNDLYHLTSAWEQEYSSTSRVRTYWIDGREQVGSLIHCHKSCRREQAGRWEVKLVKWRFNPGYTNFSKNVGAI